MRVHSVIDDTLAEGFGVRFCVWVQGCHHRCPGCMAPDTWDPGGGTEMTPPEVISRLEKRLADRRKRPLEGVTFLGGEPFEQAEDLSEIAVFARSRSLSVMTFTGYTIEELEKAPPPGGEALLAHTDLLIDGPYIEALRDFRRPWAGSSNQRFLFLTGRYSPADLEGERNRCEIRLGRDGTVKINGMADFDSIWKSLLDGG